jgi:hypothetical protein
MDEKKRRNAALFYLKALDYCGSDGVCPGAVG